jgi:hypothetical protein
VRNFGGSLGLAVLGSLLITQTTTKVEHTLGGFGVPKRIADQVARRISGAGTGPSGGPPGNQPGRVVHAVQVDFAGATKVVVIGMAIAMAIAFVVAFIQMPRGRAGEESEPAVAPGRWRRLRSQTSR